MFLICQQLTATKINAQSEQPMVRVSNDLYVASMTNGLCEGDMMNDACESASVSPKIEVANCTEAVFFFEYSHQEKCFYLSSVGIGAGIRHCLNFIHFDTT